MDVMEKIAELNYEAEYHRLLEELAKQKQENKELREQLENKQAELRYYFGFEAACELIFRGRLKMDVREKLIDLLEEISQKTDDERCKKCVEQDCVRCAYENVADHLIANGVTVQGEAKLYWKPVKQGEWNLTCSACDSHLGCKENASFCPECGAKFVYPKAVMPQPPKGE